MKKVVLGLVLGLIVIGLIAGVGILGYQNNWGVESQAMEGWKRNKSEK